MKMFLFLFAGLLLLSCEKHHPVNEEVIECQTNNPENSIDVSLTSINQANYFSDFLEDKSSLETTFGTGNTTLSSYQAVSYDYFGNTVNGAIATLTGLNQEEYFILTDGDSKTLLFSTLSGVDGNSFDEAHYYLPTGELLTTLTRDNGNDYYFSFINSEFTSGKSSGFWSTLGEWAGHTLDCLVELSNDATFVALGASATLATGGAGAGAVAAGAVIGCGVGSAIYI